MKLLKIRCDVLYKSLKRVTKFTYIFDLTYKFEFYK